MVQRTYADALATLLETRNQIDKAIQTLQQAMNPGVELPPDNLRYPDKPDLTEDGLAWLERCWKNRVGKRTVQRLSGISLASITKYYRRFDARRKADEYLARTAA